MWHPFKFKFIYKAHLKTTSDVPKCWTIRRNNSKRNRKVGSWVGFFLFVILFYQNACYGCKNTENWTWSDFFYDRRKFRRQCVNVIDTTSGRIHFLMCENFIYFISSYKNDFSSIVLVNYNNPEKDSVKLVVFVKLFYCHEHCHEKSFCWTFFCKFIDQLLGKPVNS